LNDTVYADVHAWPVAARAHFFASGPRRKNASLKALAQVRPVRIAPVRKGAMASAIDHGAATAGRVTAFSMCATSPSCDKQYENNVCRLRKDKVFVYFT
jgi:hypothetical protein